MSEERVLYGGLPPRVESDTLHQERHTCGRLLVNVKLNGLELACGKCGEKVVITWRKIMGMMLLAWA